MVETKEFLRWQGLLDLKSFIGKALDEIKVKVGDGKAIAACSGGVDSTTSAFLTHKALGGRMLTVFIDDGLRRDGESEAVLRMLRSLGLNVKLVEAKDEFFKALKGLRDPEEKRKAFREKFYSILGRVLREEGAGFLVQGTIAADIVETVRGVKTQHNVLKQVGIDPSVYGFEVIEPLKDLYKPEVRMVARELGLPPEISERMPFPGPALAIRVVGEVTPERVEVVRKATRIVEEETRGVKAFQSFAVLLNDKATGVKDGRRVYGDVIVIRVVKSKDAITAKAMKIPQKRLRRICIRIINEIPTVARCLLDITDKPPATIEFE